VGEKSEMKATVVIPTKNRPTGLLRALSSVKPSEALSVIVVDDGCDIPAAELLVEFSHPYVKAILNRGASGPAGARNFGVSMAETEIVFFLDDDDQMIAGYIDDVLAALEGEASTADFGFSSMLSGDRVKGLHGPTGLFGPQTPLAKRLGGLGMGFWIKRNCFLDAGGIDETLRVNEDTEFCIRLAKQGRTGWFSAGPGVEIRPEGSDVANDMASITTSSRAAERKVAFEVILERHGDFLAAFPKEHLSFVRRAVKYNARSGNFWGALRLAKAHKVSGHRIWLDAISGALSRGRA
jgi:glycosyltransferase involved in cell wall biosynthesis